VLDALREGRKLTIVDVQEITGRDALGAQTLLGNLKMGGYARRAGKIGRRAVYVLASSDAPRAVAPSWAARAPSRPKPVAATREREALEILLRACRIGPPPADPPYARVISPLAEFEPAGGNDLVSDERLQ